MRLRSALAGAAAAFAVVAAFAAQRRSKAHVEVHYADGSMLLLERGTPAGDTLLRPTADALAAASA